MWIRSLWSKSLYQHVSCVVIFFTTMYIFKYLLIWKAKSALIYMKTLYYTFKRIIVTAFQSTLAWHAPLSFGSLFLLWILRGTLRGKKSGTINFEFLTNEVCKRGENIKTGNKDLLLFCIKEKKKKDDGERGGEIYWICFSPWKCFISAFFRIQ